jgi:hypothetical protein
MQHVGIVLDHKLCPAERAVIMIPVRIIQRTTIVAMLQNNTLEVLFLSLQSPIGILNHTGNLA